MHHFAYVYALIAIVGFIAVAVNIIRKNEHAAMSIIGICIGLVGLITSTFLLVG